MSHLLPFNDHKELRQLSSRELEYSMKNVVN